jgi:hypothetical protein
MRPANADTRFLQIGVPEATSHQSLRTCDPNTHLTFPSQQWNPCTIPPTP